MRKSLLLITALVCVGTLAGCTPADPKNVPKAAQEVFDRLKNRQYDALYDNSSDPFKKTFTKDEFVTKMKELESFGQMLDVAPDKDPQISEEGGDKIARVAYTAKFTLAEGPFNLSLRGNDISGDWELDGYKYDVTATTFDPPYKPDQEGAEKLARRFLYLWQSRRYDDLSKTMRLQEDPDKIADFLKKLENAGQLLTMDRTTYSEAAKSGHDTAAMNYNLKFDNGTGTMHFELVELSGEWRIDTVKYNIEYNTAK
jgi:hypothetical protein